VAVPSSTCLRGWDACGCGQLFPGNVLSQFPRSRCESAFRAVRTGCGSRKVRRAGRCAICSRNTAWFRGCVLVCRWCSLGIRWLRLRICGSTLSFRSASRVAWRSNGSTTHRYSSAEIAGERRVSLRSRRCSGILTARRKFAADAAQVSDGPRELSSSPARRPSCKFWRVSLK